MHEAYISTITTIKNFLTKFRHATCENHYVNQLKYAIHEHNYSSTETFLMLQAK